jgi:hypothetical protein
MDVILHSLVGFTISKAETEVTAKRKETREGKENGKKERKYEDGEEEEALR